MARLGLWAVLLVTAIGLAASPGPAQESSSFGWQQGFPMRAGEQVLLLWNPQPGAVRYVVTRRNLVTAQESRWEVPSLQFIDSDAPMGTSFAYVVQAILSAGDFGPKLEERRVVAVAPMQPPRWIGSLQQENHVSLLWEPSDRAVFYNVYRREGKAGSMSLVASVRETKYLDTTTLPGGVYGYSIRSVGPESRESADSALREVTVKSASLGNAAASKATRRIVEVVKTIQADQLRYRLREPTDLAMSGNSLFVTDVGSASVLCLTTEGSFVYQFAQRPPDYKGSWGIPWGIAVSGDTTEAQVAVTFMKTVNVRFFRRDGRLYADIPIGKPKGFEEQPDLPQPMDVAFDADGSVWVSDFSYAQLIHLSAEGKELGRIGEPRFAKEPGPFRSPTFLLRRNGGGVFATDSLLGEIFEVDGGGKIVRRWGRPKGDEGLLTLPKGLAWTNDDEILVVDGIRSSLQSFGTDGVLHEVFYKKNRKSLDLTGLVSAAVDLANGEIYALSKIDGTIYRLRVLESPASK